MNMIGPTNFDSAMSNNVINDDQRILNRIVDSNSKSGKEGLKKVAKEFESVFISKMFSLMDQTVDREGGIFGEETSYTDNLKSYMFNEVGRQLADSPRTSFGFAKQIYEQMEKFVE